MARPLVSLMWLAAGCSSTPSATIQIVTGAETDTFTRSPAPVRLEVDSADSSNRKKTLASVPLPAASVDLGSVDVSSDGILEVSGFGADGRTLVYGQSLALAFGTLDGLTIPVFVQRTGEFARMPGPLSDARMDPLLAIVGGRYLLVAGGSSPSVASTIQLYDVASYSSIGSLPQVPRAPRSITVSHTVVLLIDGSGATQYDLSSDSTGDFSAPAGGSFSEIAGGATVTATDGTQFVVGATRTSGAPTARVLALDPTGAPSWLTLSSARLGAAAAWMDGHGLVVAGGSATAPGVEVVAVGATTGSPLAYPPDPSAGGGAVKLDSQHLLLAGGIVPTLSDAGVRAIDMACASDCTPVVWASLPTPIVGAQVFAIDPADALVVGVTPFVDATTAYRLTTSSAAPVATKLAHPGGRAIASVWGPPGSAILFGGAGEIESFLP